MPRDETAGLPRNTTCRAAVSAHPARPLLFVPHSAVRLLDADLQRASIAKKTPEGVIGGFHALRTTFITVLIEDGATFPEVQALSPV